MFLNRILMSVALLSILGLFVGCSSDLSHLSTSNPPGSECLGDNDLTFTQDHDLDFVNSYIGSCLTFNRNIIFDGFDFTSIPTTIGQSTFRLQSALSLKFRRTKMKSVDCVRTESRGKIS